MNTKEKYIGEAKISSPINRKLKFKLTPNSVKTENIADKVITLNKLSDELKDWVSKMASNTLLVAVKDRTTFREFIDFTVEAGKYAVAKDGDMYYNLKSFDGTTAIFTQVTETGERKYLSLSEEGWSNVITKHLAEGNVTMDFVNVTDDGEIIEIQ